MTDGIPTPAPEIATPELSRAGLFASTRHKVDKPTIEVAVGGTPATEGAKRIKEASDLNEAAEKARQEHPDNLRAELIAIEKTSHFSEADLDALEKTLKISGSTRVEDAIGRIRDLVKYTELARLAEEKGTTIIVEATASGGDWKTIRQSVVDLITRDGRLLESFPELNGLTTADARTALIEAMLARDPRFHDVIARELISIADTAKKELKPDPQAEELEALEKNKDALEKRQAAQFRALDSALTSLGLTPAQLAVIKENLESGIPSRNILLDIESGLVAAKGIGNEYFPLRDYSARMSQIDEYNSKISLLTAERTTLDAVTGKGRNQARINEITGLLTQYAAEKPRAEGQAKAIKDSLTTGPGAMSLTGFDKKFADFTAIKGVLGEEGAISVYVNDIHENNISLKAALGEISAKKSNPDVLERTKKRDEERETLTKRLENLVPATMSKFMEKKITDFESDQRIRLTAAAKDAAKNGETWTADGLKNIKLKLRVWSHYNPATRKTERDGVIIGRDMKKFIVAVSNGEDGSRTIIAETVGYNLDPTVEKNHIAAEILPGAEYEELTAEQKIKADAIYAKRTAEFNKLVKDQGPTIKESLMTNYLAEKGLKAKLGLGPLALNAEELAILSKGMEDTIDTAISNNSASRAALSNLESKGIKPGGQLKWLLWLFSMGLIGAAVFASHAGISPDILTTATESTGIGSAVVGAAKKIF